MALSRPLAKEWSALSFLRSLAHPRGDAGGVVRVQKVGMYHARASASAAGASGSNSTIARGETMARSFGTTMASPGVLDGAGREGAPAREARLGTRRHALERCGCETRAEVERGRATARAATRDTTRWTSPALARRTPRCRRGVARGVARNRGARGGGASKSARGASKATMPNFAARSITAMSPRATTKSTARGESRSSVRSRRGPFRAGARTDRPSIVGRAPTSRNRRARGARVTSFARSGARVAPPQDSGRGIADYPLPAPREARGEN